MNLEEIYIFFSEEMFTKDMKKYSQTEKLMEIIEKLKPKFKKVFFEWINNFVLKYYNFDEIRDSINKYKNNLEHIGIKKAHEWILANMLFFKKKRVLDGIRSDHIVHNMWGKWRIM